MPRRAARIDENQPELVNELRRLGYSVESTAGLGNGFPDLLVGDKRGRLHLLEVKNPAQPPSARRLTSDEAKFHERWRGFSVHVVQTIDDCERVLTHD